MPRYKDADKIIEFINTHLPYRASPDFMGGINDCIRMINDKTAIPTADVKEVVYGEWIGDGLECSVCGELLSNICDGDSYLSYEYSNGVDFCPECGANMKKESDA